MKMNRNLVESEAVSVPTQRDTRSLIKFKRSDWIKMPIVRQPTTTCGQIRQDSDNEVYVWTHGGKYVYARLAQRSDLRLSQKDGIYYSKP